MVVTLETATHRYRDTGFGGQEAVKPGRPHERQLGCYHEDWRVPTHVVAPRKLALTHSRDLGDD